MWLRRALVPLLTAALFGCGAGATDTSRPTAPDGRSSRNQKREEPVKLIAPPPAYGNKIVEAPERTGRRATAARGPSPAF